VIVSDYKNKESSVIFFERIEAGIISSGEYCFQPGLRCHATSKSALEWKRGVGKPRFVECGIKVV